MIEEQIFEAFLNYGVLGVVLGWFMFRQEKILKEHTLSVNQLKEVISKLCERIDK
jgi:hypothetical protein